MPSLSLSKLKHLLQGKNMIIKNYFTIDNLCIYLEIVSLNSANNFLLYIPSKYNLSAEQHKTFNLTNIDVPGETTIVDNYSEKVDNMELEDIYEDISANTNDNNLEVGNIESLLEENYNKHITFDDSTKEGKNSKEIKEIFRQLKRFRLCVQSMKYKLCIIYENYLCCIKRDDSLDCFTVSKYPQSSIKKLFISIDLESFYDKIETINNDIKNIRINISRILDKNQIKHTSNIKSISDQVNQISVVSDHIIQKKYKYDTHLVKLEELLNKLNHTEKNLLMKIHKIKKSDSMGLKTDIEKSQSIGNLEIELDKVMSTKQKIITNIMELKIEYDHLYLKTDCIYFDNIVMMDTIIKNMKDLLEFTDIA